MKQVCLNICIFALLESLPILSPSALIRCKFMAILCSNQTDYAAVVNLAYPIHIEGLFRIVYIYDACLHLFVQSFTFSTT
jgi:hypothetical protein